MKKLLSIPTIMGKASYKKLLLFFLFLGLYQAVMIAQVVDTTGITDPIFPEGEATIGGLVKIHDLIYGALVILWGYLGKLFKISAKVPHYVFVVAAGAIVIGLGFTLLGFGKFFPLLFSFLGAIGIYDLFLQPAGLKLKKKELPTATS